MSERPTRWDRVTWLVPVAAIAWAGWVGVSLVQHMVGLRSQATDFLPLWLGAKALLAGVDPNSPTSLEAVADATRIHFRVGGFYSYYPQTAALLAIPVSHVPWLVLRGPLRFALLGALACGSALAAGAGTGPTRYRVAGAAVAVGIVLSLRLSQVSVLMGQVNAVVILLTAAGLWGLGRRHCVLGGVATGLGIALKYFPIVLLPAAIVARRWRFVGSALGTVALTWGVSLCFFSALDPLSQAGEVVQFVNPRLVLSPGGFTWATPWLWQTRFAAPGALAVASLLLLHRNRGQPVLTAATAALWVAWAGTVMAGCLANHEALLMVPALAWLVAWPSERRHVGLALVGVGALLVALWVTGIASAHIRGTLRWLDLGFVLSAGCALRVAAEAGLFLRRGVDQPYEG